MSLDGTITLRFVESDPIGAVNRSLREALTTLAGEMQDGSGNWTGAWTPTAPSSLISLTARMDIYVGNIAAVETGQDTIVGTVNAPPDPAPTVTAQ